jgi:hypothetical protein
LAKLSDGSFLDKINGLLQSGSIRRKSGLVAARAIVGGAASAGPSATYGSSHAALVLGKGGKGGDQPLRLALTFGADYIVIIAAQPTQQLKPVAATLASVFVDWHLPNLNLLFWLGQVKMS